MDNVCSSFGSRLQVFLLSAFAAE